MSPWEVIEESLLRHRPARNLQWLADRLGTSIQVVHNWKSRGVPAKRYREIAEALGVTLDQLEGLSPLPWPKHAATELPPDVVEVAEAIARLPSHIRADFIEGVRNMLRMAQSAETQQKDVRDNAVQRITPARKAQ